MASETRSLERELKLRAGDGFSLDKLGGNPLEPRRLTSVYYDTPSRRLQRAGITLRRRLDDGRSAWQLKVPRSEGRLELDVESDAEAVPDSVRALLGNVPGDEPLEQLATLITDRTGRRVDGVDVTVDEVHAAGGQVKVRSFTEVEAELVHGGDERLQQVGRRLRKLGARPGKERTKLERAVGAPSTPQLRGRVRGAVAAQLVELLRHEPGARLGDDPEDVHKMRVAVRRLRAILRRVGAPGAGPLRRELGWIGDSLGAVRDADVLSAHLHAEAVSLSGGDAAKAAELLRPLHHRWVDAHERLVVDLDSDRYQRLVRALEGATRDPAFELSKRGVRRAARKQFRAAVKGGELAPTASAGAVHKRRIRIKRARYLAELAKPVRPKRARRLIAAAKRLQDVMGEHQDAVVARRSLRQLALEAGSKDAALVAGRLIEREDERLRRSRAEVHTLWRRFDKAGRRAWR
jgi:CHAD domain-containing protein/adenylate cyclase class IV